MLRSPIGRPIFPHWESDSLTDDQHYGFVGIRKNKSGSVVGLVWGRNLSRLKDRICNKGSEESIGDTKPEAKLSESGDRSPLTHTMMRVLEFGHSQYEIQGILSSLISVFPTVLVQNDIIAPIEKNGFIIDSVDDYRIHGLREDDYLRLGVKRRRLQTVERGLGALPAALLMSVVASFDSIVADVVRDLLSLKPETFRSGSKTIPLNEVLQAGSIDELREKLISDEIYQLSRGSHEEQVLYIEKNFHVLIREYWKRWPDFIEVFERRNLLAHGEKSFTSRYISICTQHGHKGSDKTLGTPVEVTGRYLQQAVDVLLEFGILVVFSIWRKQFPSEEHAAFDTLNHVAFELINSEHYDVATRILEYSLGLKSVAASDVTKKMMAVNLASAHRHSGETARCAQVLDGVDWSGSSDNFKICVAALRDDVDSVVKLMKLVSASETVKQADFKTWPVFDFVREKGEFRAEFARIFGESLREEDRTKSVDLTDPIGEEPGTENSTIH